MGAALTAPTLWVARHAPVAVEGVCYGQCDVPTRVDANAASRIVLGWLDGDSVRERVARVWSSPWRRTRDVAARISALLGVPHEMDERLSEMCFGEWEGRAYADIETADGSRFQRWMADWRHASPPGGETVDELVGRVAAWNAHVRFSKESVLAIAHAGTIRALRAISRRVDYAQIVHERVDPLLVERIEEQVR
jgi:alpha-ribazole phosphatase